MQDTDSCSSCCLRCKNLRAHVDPSFYDLPYPHTNTHAHADECTQTHAGAHAHLMSRSIAFWRCCVWRTAEPGWDILNAFRAPRPLTHIHIHTRTDTRKHACPPNVALHCILALPGAGSCGTQLVQDAYCVRVVCHFGFNLLTLHIVLRVQELEGELYLGHYF